MADQGGARREPGETRHVAFRSYERERVALPGAELVVGLYDGLATGEVVHPHAQLLVPLAGRVHLALPGGVAIVGPHEAIGLPAGTPHAAHTLDAAFRFLAVNLRAPLAPGTTQDATLWLVGEAVARVVAGLSRPADPAAFLGAAIAQLQALHGATSAPPAGDERVMAAVAAILARYAEPLTVARLARDVALSPRQLERRFKAAMGMAPRAFLVGRRMAAARELLATTDLPVEAVGAAVGCPDASHFQRSFKQATGMAAGAYRRSRRSG